MKPSELLEKAKQLIIEPLHWVQGNGGSSIYGTYCALTAIGQFAGETNYNHACVYLAIQVRSYPNETHPSISRFNDTHSHKEVIEAYTKAIEAAQKDGQ